ncbi:MAG TPA: nickel-binding protein [Geminicoccaceae bacterium]
MPIFLDRHELGGMTAAEVAEAHMKDLEVQDRYGVKFLTYWFEEERGTGFCLIDAPDRATAERVHREAHGNLPSDVIEVALSAVEAFLGRIQDPRPGRSGRVEVDGGFRAIMFTDIVGSTEMTVRLGDRRAVELVRAHDALVRRALAQCGGREVKHTGDGIMAAFDDVDAALEAAEQIQRSFERYNRSSDEPIRVRIGLHAGEPVADSNDLFGSTVQLAARLCAAAEAGGIMVSGVVAAAARRRRRILEVGEQLLKGFSEPVRLFQVEWRDGGEPLPAR